MTFGFFSSNALVERSYTDHTTLMIVHTCRNSSTNIKVEMKVLERARVDVSMRGQTLPRYSRTRI